MERSMLLLAFMATGFMAFARGQSQCTKPADIHFLLDSSSSITSRNYQKQLDFVKQFANSFTIGPNDVQIGITTFSTTVHNKFYMNRYSDKASLIAAISSINYDQGTTYTNLGLEFVKNNAFTKAHGDRDNAQNILIVITDGQSSDPAKTKIQADAIHQTNMQVFSVGVGSGVDQKELQLIASNPSDVYTVDNFDALNSIQSALQDSVCGTTPSTCQQAVDIHFLLDSSGSIGATDYQKQLNFVKQFANSFTIGPNDVQIGVTIFSTGVANKFWMNDHADKAGLDAAISSITYTGGVTHTDLGLEFVRNNAFTKEHGDRDGVDNILIVITDGQSSSSSATKVQADAIHKENINVFSVGVGYGVNQDELKLIATDPNNVYTVDNFDALNTIQKALEQAACGTTPPPTSPSSCKAPVDIHFLLDSSASITAKNFQTQLDFVKQFANSFNIGTNDVQIGVTTFSTTVTNQFWMNDHTDKNSLLSAISKIPYIGGATYTGEGLKFVKDNAFTSAHGDRDGVDNILIVITDGQSTQPSDTTLQANEIHKGNIKVFSVGVGSGVDQNELQTIASNPNDVYTVDNFDALHTIQDSLENSVCATTPAPCAHALDIHFLLDSSGSILKADYQKQLDFVKQFANSFTIGPNDVQIGVTTFSTSVKNEFWMNDHGDKNSLEAAIGQIAYNGGVTHTDLGLEFVRNNAFTKEHGDRDGVENILIVITDGQSTTPANTVTEANLIHKENINVFSVGVGSGVDQQELTTIATEAKNVYTVDNFDALTTIQQALQNQACGTAAPTPCKHPVDIHFLLDESGSIGAADYQKQLEFVKQFVNSFNIGPDEAQIGVTTFSTGVNNQFWLNGYGDKNALETAISQISYNGGTTHTDLGLEFVRNDVFTKAHGDRDNAQNILIVITDGMSTEPDKTRIQADAIHKENIRVFAIGVGAGADQNELGLIASTQSNVYSVDTFDALTTIQQALQSSACADSTSLSNVTVAPVLPSSGGSTTASPVTTSKPTSANGRGCSTTVKGKACQLMVKQSLGQLALSKNHTHGLPDNATAFQNLYDMCHNLKAARSPLCRNTCPQASNDTSVCISEQVLDYLSKLLETGKVSVDELAGTCHKCPSPHWNGKAVDIVSDARSSEYLSQCASMGGAGREEDGNIHCIF